MRIFAATKASLVLLQDFLLLKYFYIGNKFKFLFKSLNRTY